MSSFSGIFLLGILWNGLWHFSAYLIQATIHNIAWADVVGKTTGVVITYPFVEACAVKAAQLDGASIEQTRKLRVWLFLGYFAAYIAGGIGKVIGMAVDNYILSLWTMLKAAMLKAKQGKK